MRPANQNAATTANSVTNSVRFSRRVSARSRNVSQRSAVCASWMTPKTCLAVGRVDGRGGGDDDAVFVAAGEQRGLRFAPRHARGEVFRRALAFRLRDAARNGVAVEEQAIHARQEAAHARVIARQRGRVEAREHRAGRRGHRELDAGLRELAQVIVEIRRCGDQPARGAQIRDIERAVARARGAAPVAIVDEHADVLSDQRQRDTDLEHVAVAERCQTASMRGSSTASSRPYSRVSMRRATHRAGARAAEEQLRGRRACRRRPARCGRRCVAESSGASIGGVKDHRCRAPAGRGTASAHGWRPAGAGVVAGPGDANEIARVGVPFVGSAVDERRTGQYDRRDVARIAALRAAGSESARNSSSCRPLSEPAIVVVTASSDCCSLSRSTVSISRAYWQPAQGSASVVSASSSSLVRSRNGRWVRVQQVGETSHGLSCTRPSGSPCRTRCARHRTSRRRPGTCGGCA